MTKRKRNTTAKTFRRLCALEKFPTEKDAAAHAKKEAAAAGFQGGVPQVEKVTTRSGDAWLVTLEAKGEIVNT